jgi:hypothetical protein
MTVPGQTPQIWANVQNGNDAEPTKQGFDRFTPVLSIRRFLAMVFSQRCIMPADGITYSIFHEF